MHSYQYNANTVNRTFIITGTARYLDFYNLSHADSWPTDKVLMMESHSPFAVGSLAMIQGEPAATSNRIGPRRFRIPHNDAANFLRIDGSAGSIGRNLFSLSTTEDDLPFTP